MADIQFCKRCLYGSTHPLGLTLDEECICSGCRVHEEKDALDWSARWDKLQALVDPYRDTSGSNYDCIVPVSGGQDSYFILHLVKERLGLNPLLVTYNKYYNTPLGIRNLANLRIRFNCDIIYQNVNPISVKNIVRTSLRKFGSVYWPILAGQTVFPVQTAVRYKVPLIIWGAHQGVEQVGMFSHLHEVEMTRRYRKDHDLMGYEADDLLSVFDTLRQQDIWQFRYPEDDELNAVGVRGIYLGNYVRWDPKAQHEQMIHEKAYQTSPFQRTFDCYDYVDCFNYMDVHDMLKLYKHGYSKVTDHATREIRHGRITREQGLAYVRQYELVEMRNLDQFCKWLNITPRSLQFLMDRHRNAKFWVEVKPGKWAFRGWSTQQGQFLQTQQPDGDLNISKFSFEITAASEIHHSENYITFGKGYP